MVTIPDGDALQVTALSICPVFAVAVKWNAVESAMLWLWVFGVKVIEVTPGGTKVAGTYRSAAGGSLKL
jgi:hypothetical protein